MSTATLPTAPASLARILPIAGFGAAAVLIVNALKRAEILPLSPATQLVAPVGQMLSIALIIGIFVTVAALRRRLGSVGVVLYVGSLVGLAGVEFVINLVFPYIDAETIPQLLAGPLGIAFTVASITFLVGTVVFYSALWRVSGSPKVAILVIVVSSIPIALRMAFPELVLQLALVGLAVGIALLALWALRLPRASSTI